MAASSSRESVGSVGAALRSLLRCLRSRWRLRRSLLRSSLRSLRSSLRLCWRRLGRAPSSASAGAAPSVAAASALAAAASLASAPESTCASTSACCSDALALADFLRPRLGFSDADCSTSWGSAASIDASTVVSAESSDAPFLAALALDVRLAAVRRLRPGRTSAGSASAETASEVVASWTGASAAVADSAIAAASRAATAAAAAFSASTKALGLRPRRCGRKAGSTTGTSLASTGAAGSTGDVPSPAAERTEASVSSGVT